MHDFSLKKKKMLMVLFGKAKTHTFDNQLIFSLIYQGG